MPFHLGELMSSQPATTLASATIATELHNNQSHSHGSLETGVEGLQQLLILPPLLPPLSPPHRTQITPAAPTLPPLTQLLVEKNSTTQLSAHVSKMSTPKGWTDTEKVITPPRGIPEGVPARKNRKSREIMSKSQVALVTLADQLLPWWLLCRLWNETASPKGHLDRLGRSRGAVWPAIAPVLCLDIRG